MNLTLLFYFVIYCLYISTFKCESDKEFGTLRLIHVIFRHGHRTPNYFYPNDPYNEKTFFPFGVGGLTNLGKLTEYQIGEYLRQKYDCFLGNVVTENLLRAVSSDVPRTKMSLQLVLASLFPPRDAQKWNNRLNWQPIPTYYLPSDKDTIFYGSKCNENRDMFNKFKKTDNFISTMSNYTSLIGYVANKTGLNIPSFYPLLKLYFNLVSEENFGLRLPKWTKKIYPHPLNETPGIYYTQVSASNEAKQYSGGFLLKNIINEMQSQIKGAEPKERKIYLYSGHEINVAYILILLGVYDMRPPPLGSFVILELHKLNTDNFGVKVLYQNYEEIEPKLLHLPGCEKICEFNKFLRNVQNFLPEDNLKCSGMNDVV